MMNFADRWLRITAQTAAKAAIGGPPGFQIGQVMVIISTTPITISKV